MKGLPSFFALLLLSSSVITTVYGSSSSSSLLRHRQLVDVVEDDDDNVGNGETVDEFIQEDAYVTQLAEKLSPIELTTVVDAATNRTFLGRHVFLHLHHMKTGGTSMDGLLHCAMQRLERQQERRNTPAGGGSSGSIAYMNIHECGLQHYRSCRDGADDSCRNSINESSILSYCAPLMDLEKFGWRTKELDDTDEEDSSSSNTHLAASDHKPNAVTVLRHPINRVWSMYRYQTKRCYSCKNLTEIYDMIDAGNHGMDEICTQQLLNHQTRNLVREWNPDDEDIMLEGAIDNLKNFFSFVGLTEQMTDTATMVGMVFPFLNETVPGSDEKCPMPHSNASPQNNRCGPDGQSHWDLPPHPDDATAEAILKHNTMDIKLYEEAVKLFEYQKKALGLVDPNDVDGDEVLEDEESH